MRVIRRKHQDRDLDFGDDGKNIIEALNDVPPPNWGAVPVRGGRPELHVTGPQAIRVPLPPPPLYVSRARAIRGWRATLPLFDGAVRLLGFRAFLPVFKPRVKGHPALSLPAGAWLQAVSMYCDKTDVHTCSLYEQARAELRDRARMYDRQERQYRRRPV